MTQNASSRIWERVESTVGGFGDNLSSSSSENEQAKMEFARGVAQFESHQHMRNASDEPWCEELDLLRSMQASKGSWSRWSRPEVRAALKTVRLPGSGVHEMDVGLKAFDSMTYLDLSSNDITRIDNLPKALAGLTLFENQLLGASWLPLEPCDACSYLGLGFNGLDVISRDIGLSFPSLRALDLSFNSLCNLDGVTEALGSLLRIEFLTLTGNPLTILPNYRRRVAYALPGLKQLDGN